jgi:aerobic carbon-monoxide dehydrogenase large subunit
VVADVLGAPVKRVEDPKFITGKGRYLDDIKLPGMAHMAILRSPYAHANIRSIDTSAAKAAPGVIAVESRIDVVPKSCS